MQSATRCPTRATHVFAAQTTGSCSSPQHKNPTFTARLDRRFSDKTFVFARLTEIYWTQDSRRQRNGPLRWTAYRHDRAVNANFTHVFNPKLIAEIRATPSTSLPATASSMG
jgi:hypothetical protein